MAIDMGLGAAPDLSAFRAKPPQVSGPPKKPGFGQRFRQGMKDQQKQGQDQQKQDQPKKQYDLGPNFSTRPNPIQAGQIQSFKKGGRVKKTGLALVHRGELVIPAKRRHVKNASHKKSIVKL